MSLVFFLGAGASASDGAPVQNALFENYFSNVIPPDAFAERHAQLRRYFREMFELDSAPPFDQPFPTFEEAVGLIDVSLRRSEELRPYGLDDLRKMRETLIACMAQSIAQGLGDGPAPAHTQFVIGLRDRSLIDDCSFISVNYDICIDNAIERAFETSDNKSPVDYGLGDLAVTTPSDERRVKLCKIHGSLNWLLCPQCSRLRVTHLEKGMLELILGGAMSRCPRCNTKSVGVIVPPSYYKDMSNLFLEIVWTRAERILSEASQVVFCGYSFPDADMHVKYLLKRAQLNRGVRSAPLRVVVMNEHRAKTGIQRSSELERYERFFGRRSVSYAKLGFADLAADPGLAFA